MPTPPALAALPPLDWRGVPAAVAATVAACKRADGPAYLAPYARAFAGLQRPLGGPNPLTTALVGGALGAGLGYGGGALAEHLLPVERGRLRRSLAVAGGLAGSGLGLGWWGVNAAHPDATGGGLRAAVSPWPFALKAAWAAGATPADVGYPAESGAFYVPSIPVDAFNEAVWDDVHAAPNPFGTRSPWGDASQPLGTPPPAAAAVSGLLAGTQAAVGSPLVSPYHVARTAAVAGGQGYVAGALAGKVLGALAGLTPDAQANLRRLGLWGGLISGVAGTVFGGPGGQG